jgi:chromosome segregation ATPase
LLDEDPHKHYGFLGKSDRFQTIRTESSGDINTENDDETEYRKEIAPRPDEAQRVRKEELAKLKLENEKIQEIYQKQIQNNQKEMNIMSERCQKLETTLQNVVKERTTIQKDQIAAEKELQELKHKYNALRQKVLIN